MCCRRVEVQFRMSHFFMTLMYLFVLGTLANGVYLTTCARMDTPILEKGARALCIASCSAQEMNWLLLLAVTLLTFDIIWCQLYLTTCARMDVPIVDKIARAACITSCSVQRSPNVFVQNCGTGNCENRSGRKTCVCFRCASGGNVPLESLIKNKGK
ncbi:unnamed protein product [Heligmosomoides polygyrus]|uniref:Uncharacterized protein n=1 Tax=Heligmosomoides polygyrus TaxID=6339 RepID=A0A183FT35_HELPZ|nr:unnamed protein product [Heligmosomoides polygyrus]